jgi:LuxR family maltose regulon positive regulatory protein
VTTTLLPTKLSIPPLRPRLVARPRLTERLNDGLWSATRPRELAFARRLTLVAAPAGFGKTTAVIQWLSNLRDPAAGFESAPSDDRSQNRNSKSTIRNSQMAISIAWFSLDEGDDDPYRFFSYVAAAVDGIRGAGDALQGLVSSFQDYAPQTLATALIQDAAGAVEPFVVVLDDYHLVTSPAIGEAMAFLLEHMPLRMHLVLTSRSVPELPLSRMRGRGQVLEIGQGELRFSPDEAGRFFNETMELELESAEAAALEARTEGWVAGLQLASIALQTKGPTGAQGDREREAFIGAFAGDDRYVSDYLVSEVLERLPETSQEFLLHTSVLERLNGDLCDALTGRSDGQAMLQALQQANIFTIPLDNTGRWYRYHGLLAGALRHRLLETAPDMAPLLHQRASDWYSQYGYVDEALGHALAAGDLERAAGIIEAVGRPMLARGEIAPLRRWLRKLPMSLIRTRPNLVSLYIIVEIIADITGEEILSVREMLADAIASLQEDGRDGDEKDALLAELLAQQAILSIFDGQSDLSQAFVYQALDQVPEGDDFRLGFVKLALGFIHRYLGHTARSIRAFTESIEHGKRSDSAYVALAAVSNLVQLYEVTGELSQAERLNRQALDLVIADHGRSSPLAGIAYVGLAKVLRERNELEAAEDYLEQAIDLGRISEQNGVVVDGLITLALVQRGRRRWEAAYAALDDAEQIFRRSGNESFVPITGSFRARLQLAQGDIRSPVRWAKATGIGIHDDLEEQRESLYLTLARILIAQAEIEPALELLGRLQADTEAAGRQARLIETLLLLALAHERQARRDLAAAAMARAIGLAEPEGYVRTFADEAPTFAGASQGTGAASAQANCGRPFQ